MVDEVANRGLLSWLLHTVEGHLEALTDDIIGEFVLSLINEATGNLNSRKPPRRGGPPGPVAGGPEQAPINRDPGWWQEHQSRIPDVNEKIRAAR